jgi:hypothetical protein
MVPDTSCRPPLPLGQQQPQASTPPPREAPPSLPGAAPLPHPQPPAASPSHRPPLVRLPPRLSSFPMPLFSPGGWPTPTPSLLRPSPTVVARSGETRQESLFWSPGNSLHRRAVPPHAVVALQLRQRLPRPRPGLPHSGCWTQRRRGIRRAKRLDTPLPPPLAAPGGAAAPPGSVAAAPSSGGPPTSREQARTFEATPPPASPCAPAPPGRPTRCRGPDPPAQRPDKAAIPAPRPARTPPRAV